MRSQEERQETQILGDVLPGLQRPAGGEGAVGGSPAEEAVRGMLPKGPLGRQQLRKLKVYAGPDHPHAAQQPKTLEVAHAQARDAVHQAVDLASIKAQLGEVPTVTVRSAA